MSERLNLGELRRDGVLFYTREAAAILYEVSSQLNYAEEMGSPLAPPTLDQLEVTSDGELILGVGPADSASSPMPALASLIEQVLPPTLTDQSDYAVPGSFRVLAPRCRGWPPGLPPISTSGDLAAAIRRYQSGDSVQILGELFARHVDLRSAAPPIAAPVLEHADRVSNDQTNDVPAGEAATPISNTEFSDDVAEGDFADVPLWFNSPEQPDAEPPALEVRPAQYPRRAVWAVILVLLAFGASYGITRWAVARQERIAHAQERSPAAGDARDEHVPAPQTQGEPLPADAGTARSDVPAAGADHARSASSTATRSLSTAPLNIPDSTGPTFSPSFASGGSSLVFHAGRDPSARLMMTDLQRGATALNVTPILDDAARNYHPRLSPNGRNLAFDSDRDGVRGIYLADRDGAHVHRVSGQGFAALPSWSPDMHALAFVRGESGRPKVWNLWLHDLSTGSERRLTNYRYGQTWSGSWFSDARRLCFSHEDRLVILDLDTGRTQQFRSPQTRRLVRTPAVSPDGQRIVFQVSRSGVWILDMRTKAMRRIIDDASAEEFAWAPDGRRLAYHSRRTGTWRIWVATLPNELSGP